MTDATNLPNDASVHNDAVDMLVADHQKVRELFDEFKELKESDATVQEKVALVEQITTKLKVHAEVEDEIFYPAVSKALHDEAVVIEATTDQDDAEEAVDQLEALKPSDAGYDDKVLALGKEIEEHVQEEEVDIFPRVKETGLDRVSLGKKMAERKDELTDVAATTAGIDRALEGTDL